MTTKPPTQSAPPHPSWQLFLHAHAAITRAMDTELQRTSSVTLRDYEVMLILWKATLPGLRMSDVADRVLLTPSGITRLIRGLEDRGLVERETCNNDMRVSYVRLTDTGRSEFSELRDRHLEHVRELFTDRFSPEQLDQLEQLLNKLPRTRSECSGCTAASEAQH